MEEERKVDPELPKRKGGVTIKWVDDPAEAGFPAEIIFIRSHSTVINDKVCQRVKADPEMGSEELTEKLLESIRGHQS